MGKVFVSFCILFALSGCGQGSTTDVIIPPPKGIFSLWTGVDGSKFVFDLHAMKFGFNQFSINLQNLSCTCALAIAGSANQGTFNIFNCVASPGATVSDQVCGTDFNQSGNYQLDNAILTLCTVTAANPTLQIPDGGLCKKYN